MIELYKPVVLEFESTDTLYRHACDYIEEKLVVSQSEKGVARLLLSGGQTPMPVYEKLGQSSIINWGGVELYQTDERYVSKELPDSNQNTISKYLTEDVIEELKEVHFFNASLPVEQAIADYNERIEALDDVFFDQTVLGIGEDGHIASLFPSSNDLKVKPEVFAIPTLAPENYDIRERLSLTIDTILNSEDILVLLVGERKINVLTELLEGNLPAIDFPAKSLLAHPKVKILCYFQ